MGSKVAPSADAPRSGRTLSEVDAEYARLHAEVTTLLDRLNALRSERQALLAEEQTQLAGPALAVEALSSTTAAEQLAELTRAMHPRMIDVQRYSADVSGLTPAWAPAVLLHRHTSLEEVRELADTLWEWVATYQPVDPFATDPTAVPRHGGAVLIDVRGSGNDSRRRGQVWVRRTGDVAVLLDSDSGERMADGTLAHVLVEAASLYHSND